MNDDTAFYHPQLPAQQIQTFKSLPMNILMLFIVRHSSQYTSLHGYYYLIACMASLQFMYTCIRNYYALTKLELCLTNRP